MTINYIVVVVVACLDLSLSIITSLAVVLVFNSKM